MSNNSTLTWKQFAQHCLSLSLSSDPPSSFEQDLVRLIERIEPNDTTIEQLFVAMTEEPITEYRTHLFLDEATCRIMLVLLQKDGQIGLHNHPHHYN